MLLHRRFDGLSSRNTPVHRMEHECVCDCTSNLYEIAAKIKLHFVTISNMNFIILYTLFGKENLKYIAKTL